MRWVVVALLVATASASDGPVAVQRAKLGVAEGMGPAQFRKRAVAYCEENELTAPSKKRTARMFSVVDRDNDGLLSKDEKDWMDDWGACLMWCSITTDWQKCAEECNEQHIPGDWKGKLSASDLAVE